MIDIKAIRHQFEHDSYGTGHSWVRAGSLIALCDEIERLRKDAAAYHALKAELDKQMGGKQ